MHLLVDCPRLSDNRSMLRRDYAISQRDVTERLKENCSVFSKNRIVRIPFVRAWCSSWLPFCKVNSWSLVEIATSASCNLTHNCTGVKFENGRFQQSLPPRISELRIHSSSLIRVDGRRPSWTRLSGRNRKTVTHKSIQCNLFVTLCKEDHIKKIRTFCGSYCPVQTLQLSSCVVASEVRCRRSTAGRVIEAGAFPCPGSVVD